jgi:tetratricopeptide (TPR) repeat protein
MKKAIMKKSLFVTFFLISILSNAQLPSGSYKDYMREGVFLLMEENYEMALKNFLKAYEIDSSSSNINYNVGICYLRSNQRTKAEHYLERAVKNVTKTYNMDDPGEKKAPPLAHFYYGQALHVNYKFDEAVAEYDKFGSYVSTDKDWKKDIAYYKKQSEYAKELVAAPLNVQISNLGDSINSEYPDFSPTLSADERTMIFTTRRSSSTGGERDFSGQFYEDIVVSYKDDMGRWTRPVPLSEYVNTNGHEASINLTPDGQTLIVFKGLSATDGNIYYSEWDGKTWSGLQEFGSDINSKFWESHACLNADKTALFFVSDRPGGKGGRDIYRCVKLPNGKWSKALNCGPSINTEYDEDGGFIHPDGKQFFFASKGHNSMGGFDLFFSILDEENKFSEPINMRYPINTPDDDVFYVTSPDGKRSYFSSAKEGGLGEKDIYMISVQGVIERPLALFKGQIVPAEGEKLPDDLMIVVTDKTTGEKIGEYKPKIVNGTFSIILPPGREYTFSYQSNGEEFYNEDVFVTNELSYQEIKKEINLEPVKLLGKVKVKDKGIIFNPVVLNNAKEKKAVSGAKITLVDSKGDVQTADSDAKGKILGINLKADNSYTVVAEHDGKKSAPVVFNTKGVKGSKNMSQVIYMDGKPAKTSQYTLSLNVLVQNNAKQRKPVGNANVVLIGNDGSKHEGQTDEKGHLKGVALESDVNYEVSATKDDLSSEKSYFTTNNTKANKVYSKTIYLETAPTAPVATTAPGKYEFHFGYNHNKIDEAEQSWVDLIDRIVALSQKKTVTVNINSSASKVPCMRVFKNNKELAASRATVTEEKIKAAVEAKGGDVKKLKFVKASSVNGPPWRNDHDIHRAIFEKYQYVKVSAK